MMLPDKAKTAVVVARVDIKDLATCAKFFIDNGLRLNSRSDLLWRIIHSMAETIHLEGADSFVSSLVAFEYLEGLGLGNFTRTSRATIGSGRDTLSKVISAEIGVGQILNTDEESGEAWRDRMNKAIPEDTANPYIELFKSGKVKIPGE
jgi:hypothetical protein